MSKLMCPLDKGDAGCAEEKCAWWVSRLVDLQVEKSGKCAIKRIAEKK